MHHHIIRAVIALIAAALLATSLAAAPAQARVPAETGQTVATPVVSAVKATVGSHIYVHLTRRETMKVYSYYSKAYTAAAFAAICTSLGSGLLTIALCAAAGAVVAQALQEGLEALLRRYPNLCLVVSVKYLPFTSATRAYSERCYAY